MGFPLPSGERMSRTKCVTGEGSSRQPLIRPTLRVGHLLPKGEKKLCIVIISPMPDTERDFLIAYLAERDVGCPKCSYSLRGLQEAICPECGQLIELRVLAPDPPMGAWTFGLVWASGGAVFCLLLAVSLARYLLMYGMNFPGLGGQIALVIGGLAVSVTVLVSWIARRRRVWRWGAARRRLTAALISIFAMAAPIVIMFVLR